MSEIEYLKQAQCGNRHAFSHLYAIVAPAITRFVRRLIGWQSQVDDITQETMLALYNNMHRIDPPENLWPYVYRIARNRCYDALRHQGRYDKVSLDEDAVRVRVSFEVNQQHQSKMEETTHWLLMKLEVEEAMEHLPELQRQALILYSEEGLTYAEIAEVMDVSIGTIKSRLYHAKQTLRRLLKSDTLRAIEEG